MSSEGRFLLQLFIGGSSEGGDHPTSEAAKALVLGLDGFFFFYSAANRIMKFNYSLVNHHLSLTSQEEEKKMQFQANVLLKSLIYYACCEIQNSHCLLPSFSLTLRG